MDAPCRHSTLKHLFTLPLAFALTGLCLLPFDVQIASALNGERAKWLSDFLEVSEIFGHGIGATFVVIAAVVLDPAGLRNSPWLIAGSLGSGCAANLLKLAIPRIRPRDFDLVTGKVWQTFVLGSDEAKSMQSMPSAHTATAVGLAIVLTAICPRGRFLFAALAMLVGLQRIATQAHFPSDVCGGAAVGCFVGICSASLLPKRNEADEPENGT